jgi:hypothetical protein
MQKHSSPEMQLTQRGAAFRVRQLLAELQLLVGSFPDLHDAFDADELPLAFILRRDSRLMKRSPQRRERLALPVNDQVRRRTMRSRAQSRRGPRKQMSDE